MTSAPRDDRRDDAGALDLGAYLRRGDHIVWGQACGEPTTLVEALIAQAEGIGGLSAFAATSFSGLLSAEAAAKIKPLQHGRHRRAAHGGGRREAGIVPCHVSQVAPMIEQGLIGCDVAFVQVSPPDADGNHSFGLIGDFVQAAVAKARVVIAEVNERVPFTLGDAVLPAARIDCAVHVARIPVEVPPAQIGETDQCDRPDRGRLHRGRRGDSGRRSGRCPTRSCDCWAIGAISACIRA